MTESSCHVILNGGLGNQLFQVAAAYAHCKRNGYRLSISEGNASPRPTYWDKFLHKARPFIGSGDPTVRRWMEPFWHYSLIPKHVRYLFGYFQSSKYFNDISGEIRELFTPPFSIVDAVNAKYNGLVKPNSVAIHVRRGDYVIPEKINFHFVTTNSYFERAIAEARRKDPSAEFVVFSEDVEWCRAQSFFAGATIIDEPDECLSMELMSRFRRYIISNSSFSWWSVYLGAPAEMVISPDRWFGPTGIQDWQDVYEPSWTIIKTE
jgi:hypothetical protein